MESRTVLSVHDLNISFPGKNTFTAVNNLSFDIAAGSTLVIVGESGSGKSLTALSLMGLLPKTAVQKGSISLRASDKTIDLDKLAGTSSWSGIRGKDIGMIFQEPMSSLNPVMTVGRQIRETLQEHHNISRRQAKETALEWLAKVQLPDPAALYYRYPHQLSGGQKQRVMIAMAMCNNPALLLADEPTTALDVTVQREIIQLMQSLQKQYNTAIIFITHDMALAAEVATDMLVLYQGEAVEYGPAATVLTSPRHPYTRALMACRPSGESKGHRLPIVSDVLGKDGSDIKIPDAPQAFTSAVSSEALLTVNGLRVWYPGSKSWVGKPGNYFKAVEDVSFTLHKGETLGLVGESGCGKSTLSASIIGLIPVKEGQILYNGKDLATLPASEWKAVRREIQMVFQDPFASLNPRMTIEEMLTEPLKVHHILSRSSLKDEARRLIDLVQLPAGSLNRYPHQFSGGQRQRLGIARALALRPKLLICDEMVSALDVSVQAQILNLLKELQRQFDLSYLFISHDLSVVYYMSDNVMVMKSGIIVEAGEATQVLEHPGNDYTKKLIAAMPQR